MSGPKTLEITRIAETALSEKEPWNISSRRWMAADPKGSEAGQLSEFAGRACYASWKKPNPATATTAGYIDHILDVGHFSKLGRTRPGRGCREVTPTVTKPMNSYSPNAQGDCP